MPSYALICRFDNSDTIKQLKKEKKKLCLSTDVVDPQDSSKNTDGIVGTTTDIQSGTILHWRDAFKITATDTAGNETAKYVIAYGQAFSFNSASQTVSVTDDEDAPPNGFIFSLDAETKITLYQNFLSDKWGKCHTKKYAEGNNKYSPSMEVCLSFENTSEGSTSTVAKDDKFHIDFTNKFTQTAYYNSAKVWTLVAPDSYSAGALVSLTKGNGGYVISQARSRDYSLPPTDAKDQNSTRQRISAGFGPITLAIYVDIKSFEVGVEATLFGISLGTLYGNLNDGVILHIDLLLGSGQIRLYLDKNPKEIWASVNVTFMGGASIAVDEKRKLYPL